MATAPLTFPVLPSGKVLNSATMETTQADPGMRQEAEGGYVITRARYTRKPVKRFKGELTNIIEADRQVLQNFWDAARGTSRSFAWTDPVSQTPYIVRFAEAMTFTYKGAGGNHFWDCSLSLEQV